MRQAELVLRAAAQNKAFTATGSPHVLSTNLTASSRSMIYQILWKHNIVIGFLKIITATVWLLFGIWFKLMGMVPRHRLIVAAVLGEEIATPTVILIGIAETTLGLWILSGIKPRWCATVQSLAIVTMNALELGFARDLLLAPGLMVVANTLFLILVWYWALNSPQKREI